MDYPMQFIHAGPAYSTLTEYVPAPYLRKSFRLEVLPEKAELLICGLGGVIGLVVGVTLSLLQQHLGLIEIPAESFLTKSYPVEFRMTDLVVVAAAFAVVAALLANVTVRSMIKKTTR